MWPSSVTMRRRSLVRESIAWRAAAVERLVGGGKGVGGEEGVLGVGERWVK